MLFLMRPLQTNRLWFWINSAYNRFDISRFIRFLVIGCSNALVSFIAYLLAIKILPRTPGMASVAQTISYSAGILWSYIWNRIWVFCSKRSVMQEGIRFIIVQLSLLITSALAIGLAVDIFNFHRIWAWLFVMAFITLLNYLLLKFWAFRDEENAPTN